MLALTTPVLNDPARPFLAPRRLAEALGLTLSDLAALSGVARNTLASSASSRAADAALSSIARIFLSASEMAGDEARAAIWFKHQPLPGYGGLTAFDLVRDGRAQLVLDYLESVRAGVYA
jgi:transcriptional regulator with XRE-family HTH domain